MLNAEEIIERLRHYGHEAYIVGGAVRDKLMGLEPKDKDICTSASPDEVETIFSDCNYKSFGKSFFVSFVDEIEVSTFRIDRYQGLNDKNVEIKPAKTAKEDVMRRDFTINGLLLDPFTNQIIDYVDGTKDIERRVIRFIGTPEHRIWEDPNRIVRACRFAAKINGDFEEKTWESLKKYSDYIDSLVDSERIQKEIMKAMEIKKASLFFRALHDIGGLLYIFPSLENCVDVPGGPHHIEPVFDHCMMSGDSVSTKYPLIKLASYLHDVGKGICVRINPRTDDIWFEGHDSEGAKAVEDELRDLRFSNEDIIFIRNLIDLHMRISTSRLSPRAVRRTLKMLEDYNISYKSLIRLSISDKRGNIRNSRFLTLLTIKELVLCFLNEINRENKTSKFSDLKVDGYEIMKITGLNQGKYIGEILEYLLDCTIEDPNLNNPEDLKRLILERKI